MPMYEFKNEDGVVEEHFFPMSEAPALGSKVMVDDRLLTRIPSLPRATVKSYRFVAQSQPMCNPDGSVPEGVVAAPHYDMNPDSPNYRAACFQSKAEIADYCARAEGRVTYGE